MGIHDLHMHSSASCDSHASIWDMCESAIGLGLEAVAFTEHVEFGPGDYCYGAFDYHRARRTWEKARDKYRGKLEVLFGAEVTYWSHLEDEICRYLEKHPFDVVIGSVHDAPPINFWNPRNAEAIRANPGQARTALKTYFAEAEKLALSGLFSTVGHFGVYERYIPDAWPEVPGDAELEGRLVSALEAIAQNSRFEVNAAVLHKPGHWPAPRVEVLKLYREMGGLPPTFGSDAHYPSRVAGNWRLAQEVIRQAGFSEFAHWTEVLSEKGPSYGPARESAFGLP